jgi:hypothetical protein
MADIEYDVSYLARSPAGMKQDDFAELVDELCNGRAATGWRLASAVGDYGANVTLGVWLLFDRKPGTGSDRFAAATGADEPAPVTADIGDEGAEATEEAPAEGEESP